MLIKTFPLIRPGVFSDEIRELVFKRTQVLVKPTYLSICAADQRYFCGKRSPEILRKKLPMILIHEAIGQVLSSTYDEVPSGSTVVLLPCGPRASLNSNYNQNAFFRSSNADGFCQELLSLDVSELLPISDVSDPMPFLFSELLSVCYQAKRQIESEIESSKKIAIWGDGSLSYLMSLVLKTHYPEKSLTVIGKHEDKLKFFSFCDQCETVFEQGKENFDVLIECVGGDGAQRAINEMIIRAEPKATLLLSGVSENPPSIDTRKILEKGLTLRGTTRSIREDFILANHFLRNSSNRNLVRNLISNTFYVRDASDLRNAFEMDQTSRFKTVIALTP